MVLYSKNVLSGVGQPLIRSIVDILKRRYGNGRIQIVGIHDISVVLGRNVNAPVREITHRMVAAAVSLFHFMCIRAVRKRHQLMSETDRKDRDIGCIELSDLLNHRCALLRVSRSV